MPMIELNDITTRVSSHVDWAAEPDLPELRRSLELLEIDPRKAFEMLIALKNRGSIMSMVYLGGAYNLGLFGERDAASAERLYAQASDRGSKVARYLLGRVYSDLGQYDKAKEEFRVGADDGFAPAAQELGRMYWVGAGGEKNLHFAETFLCRAADLGSPRARGMVGRILIEKRSGLRDTLRGLRLMLQASIQLFMLRFRNRRKDRAVRPARHIMCLGGSSCPNTVARTIVS